MSASELGAQVPGAGVYPAGLDEAGQAHPRISLAQDPQLKCGEETRSFVDFLSALTSNSSRP